MARYQDVLGCIHDFRAQLHLERQAEDALTPAILKVGLRGILGRIVTPLGNIHAVGVGIRKRKGKYVLDDFVIKLYVYQKKAHASLRKMLPAFLQKPFHGVDVDVEELPVMRAYSSPADHVKSHRPIPAGVVVKALGSRFAGTLGCYVTSNSGVFILSNNHVLADTNRLPIGEPVIQPSFPPNDPTLVFARLTEFEPIQLPTPGQSVSARNRIDAAIAEVTDPVKQSLSDILGIPNYVPQLANPMGGMKVTKAGAATGVTTGTINATLVSDLNVDYGGQGSPLTAVFDESIQIDGDGGEPFSAPGDSGSVVVEVETGKPVALLFAGFGNQSSACDLTAVCRRFGVIPT